MWHGVPFACQRRPIVGVLRTPPPAFGQAAVLCPAQPAPPLAGVPQGVAGIPSSDCHGLAQRGGRDRDGYWNGEGEQDSGRDAHGTEIEAGVRTGLCGKRVMHPPFPNHHLQDSPTTSAGHTRSPNDFVTAGFCPQPLFKSPATAFATTKRLFVSLFLEHRPATRPAKRGGGGGAGGGPC